MFVNVKTILVWNLNRAFERTQKRIHFLQQKQRKTKRPKEPSLQACVMSCWNECAFFVLLISSECLCEDFLTIVKTFCMFGLRWPSPLFWGALLDNFTRLKKRSPLWKWWLPTVSTRRRAAHSTHHGDSAGKSDSPMQLSIASCPHGPRTFRCHARRVKCIYMHRRTSVLDQRSLFRHVCIFAAHHPKQ